MNIEISCTLHNNDKFTVNAFELFVCAFIALKILNVISMQFFSCELNTKLGLFTFIALICCLVHIITKKKKRKKQLPTGNSQFFLIFLDFMKSRVYKLHRMTRSQLHTAPVLFSFSFLFHFLLNAINFIETG